MLPRPMSLPVTVSALSAVSSPDRPGHRHITIGAAFEHQRPTVSIVWLNVMFAPVAGHPHPWCPPSDQPRPGPPCRSPSPHRPRCESSSAPPLSVIVLAARAFSVSALVLEIVPVSVIEPTSGRRRHIVRRRHACRTRHPSLPATPMLPRLMSLPVTVSALSAVVAPRPGHRHITIGAACEHQRPTSIVWLNVMFAPAAATRIVVSTVS